MVVDDTPENLRLLTRILQSRGYRVSAHAGARDALAVAAATPPDLILLDITMPGMTGLEMCELLKSDPALAEIPVLFVSALTGTADKVSAFKAGGVDFITKPFQIDEIHARLRVHLELRDQRRQLQRANERLRELEVLRDALVHMAVHDMRSPLAVARTNLEYARRQGLPAEADLALRDGLTAVQSLSDFVNAILDVSRLEAAQLALSVSSVDLAELAREQLAHLDVFRGGRTVIVTSSPRPLVACDPGIVRRVIQNLLGNALKFTDDCDGRVDVAIDVDDTRARVVVRDNGPGIAPEFHQRIFDKFFQVATPSLGLKPSTGIGLTFCKLAVEAHGGHIGVESVEGEGSTFWFELPPRSPRAVDVNPTASR